MSEPPSPVQPEELEWINLVEKIDAKPSKEGALDKIIRKSKENPLVPIGFVVTCSALAIGLRQMYLGNRWMSQYMMRLRVGAQIFTVTALLGGTYIREKRLKANPTPPES